MLLRYCLFISLKGCKCQNDCALEICDCVIKNEESKCWFEVTSLYLMMFSYFMSFVMRIKLYLYPQVTMFLKLIVLKG